MWFEIYILIILLNFPVRESITFAIAKIKLSRSENKTMRSKIKLLRYAPLGHHMSSVGMTKEIHSTKCRSLGITRGENYFFTLAIMRAVCYNKPNVNVKKES